MVDRFGQVFYDLESVSKSLSYPSLWDGEYRRNHLNNYRVLCLLIAQRRSAESTDSVVLKGKPA